MGRALLERDRGRARADDAARPPDHDPDHGDAEQQHAIERGIEPFAEDALAGLGMAQRLEAADHDDGRDGDAELAAHAAEHDDGKDDGRTR